MLGHKLKTHYLAGKVIEDTIKTKGDKCGKDWTYGQHREIDTVPKEEDFKKTIADYLSFKVSSLLKEEGTQRDFQ